MIRHPVASPCASTRARWRSWKRNTRTPSTVSVVKGSSQRATSGRPRERQPATSAPAPANTAHRRSPRVNTAAGTARFHLERSSRPPGSTRAETVTADRLGLGLRHRCDGQGLDHPCLLRGGLGRLRDHRARDRYWDRPGGTCRGCHGGGGSRNQGQRQGGARQLHHRKARPRLGEDHPDARTQPQQHSLGRMAGAQGRAARVAAAAASTGTGRSASSDAKSPCKASRAAVGAGQIRTSRPPSGRTSAMTTVCAAGASRPPTPPGWPRAPRSASRPEPRSQPARRIIPALTGGICRPVHQVDMVAAWLTGMWRAAD